MEKGVLIDTDVLIDYLRGNPAAVGYVEGLSERFLISVITVAELYAGVFDGDERIALESLLSEFEIIPVSKPIAVSGGLYRRAYRKSHGVGLADAIIAATAEAEGVSLATLNTKHFPMTPDLVVPYKR